MINKYYKRNSSQADTSELDATGKTVFDDIYTAPDPRSYCEAMQALDYTIPKHALPMFSDLFQDYREQSGKESVRVLDLGSSYGINAALLRFDLGLSDLYQRYTSPEAQALTTSELMQRDRSDYYLQPTEKTVEMVGFDISAPALQYAQEVGLIVDSVQANLEVDEVTTEQSQQLENTDCIISSGCIGYVTTTTLEKIIDVCTPHLPWMGHCVLRMFSLQQLTTLLKERGYDVDIAPEPVPQRRFASHEEQTQVLSRLHELGVDPTGLEDQGWLYAWLITATPAVARAEQYYN